MLDNIPQQHTNASAPLLLLYSEEFNRSVTRFPADIPYGSTRASRLPFADCRAGANRARYTQDRLGAVRATGPYRQDYRRGRLPG